MVAPLHGFQFQPTDEKNRRREERHVRQFVPDFPDDGATEVSPALGGAYGSFVDLDGHGRNEVALINRYRTMSLQSECDAAIDDITNEAIDSDWKSSPVEINMDDLDVVGERTKRIISEQFDEVLSLLDFQNKAYETFRRWYVDGRLNYQIVIDHEKPEDGIQRLVYVDPRKIKKVRKPRMRKTGDSSAGPLGEVPVYLEPLEFFVYNPQGVGGSTHQGQRGIRLARDSVAYITSGIMDANSKLVLSHLHKAIKPLNNLRYMEDSSVIYRLARAPERRIFYIDVGNLPKRKAEQYVKDMMNRYKNRLVYDATTGTIRDDRRFLTMLEDYWLPRREGGRGTEISTLPGGDNLGQIQDIEYFQQNLYKALNVPVSRLNPESGFNIGRSSEITRDEVKFHKFIVRLRKKFTDLFDTLLCRQLILKGILSSDEWDEIKEGIAYDFRNDTHFEELKESEINRDRVALLGEIDPFVGKYVSRKWVRKNVLRQTDEEIDEMNKEMEEELQDTMDSGDIDGDGIPDNVAAASPTSGIDPPEEDDGGKGDGRGGKTDAGKLISGKKRRNKRHAIGPSDQ